MWTGRQNDLRAKAASHAFGYQADTLASATSGGRLPRDIGAEWRRTLHACSRPVETIWGVSKQCLNLKPRLPTSSCTEGRRLGVVQQKRQSLVEFSEDLARAWGILTVQ